MKKITVEIAGIFDYTVEFDINSKTEEICNKINNFWSEGNGRLEAANGCIYSCVTRLIANEIIRLQLKSPFYREKEVVIEAFSDGIKGFYPIDGRYGIKLIYCDDFELNDLDVEFKHF
ncbi:DUF2528 family protein [Aliarcobacter lanthieri]|uniref:DUF2528 family protein n=1 Tax=Aliarcobacter lanthieri TaxID=1355374 RepID=UPI003AB0F533